MVASVARAGIGTILKRGDGGVGAGAIAAVEWGTTTGKIRIKNKTAGTSGNGKNVTVALGASRSIVAIDSTQMSVVGLNAAETVSTFISWLYQQSAFDTYYNADWGATPGDGTGALTARTITAMSGGTDGTEVFTAISEVKNISGPARSQNVLDITTMESPNYYREYLPSLLDAGEINFDMNFTNVASQQGLITDLEARTKRNFQLVFPTAAATVTYSFAAYVTKVENNFQIEAAISAAVTLKLSGGITVS